MGCGDVAEAAERPAKRDQHRALGIHRDARLAELDVGEARRLLRFERELERCRVLREARERKGERLVELAVVVLEQRHAAHHAVVIRQRRVEEAGGRCGLLQHGDVRREAAGAQPVVRVDARVVEHHAGRQFARLRALGGARPLLEDIAEHDVARDQRFGQDAIPFVLVADLGELHQPLGVAGERPGGELVDQAQLGIALRLREQHVEAERADAVVVKERIGQRRDLAARPGPLALGGEARLVDVHDHDPRIDDPRHHRLDAHVVQVVLDALDELERQDAGGVEHEEQQRQGREQDPLQHQSCGMPNCGEPALAVHFRGCDGTRRSPRHVGFVAPGTAQAYTRPIAPNRGIPVNIRSLAKGLKFCGEATGKRQTYYVFESGKAYVVMSASRTKRASGYFNLVSRAAVDRIRKSYAGKQDVTAKAARRALTRGRGAGCAAGAQCPLRAGRDGGGEARRPLPGHAAAFQHPAQIKKGPPCGGPFHATALAPAAGRVLRTSFRA